MSNADNLHLSFAQLEIAASAIITIGEHQVLKEQ
jgi:hypothetical protein